MKLVHRADHPDRGHPTRGTPPPIRALTHVSTQNRPSKTCSSSLLPSTHVVRPSQMHRLHRRKRNTPERYRTARTRREVRFGGTGRERTLAWALRVGALRVGRKRWEP